MSGAFLARPSYTLTSCQLHIEVAPSPSNRNEAAATELLNMICAYVLKRHYQRVFFYPTAINGNW